ncbi:ATP-binding protein [Stygiolobus caldivivus]|uniref:Uncharacterized protein n=1 Tax=Stygiolobus caldivivus TaxID=2824673 RepID=A0A8D5U423_9CREN|nr:ATP-binding protein [Stygiolobus caldivivus]BCU68862.1 hypothetical protein KN1_01590 [Stygiolobus caldivivus]
MRGEDFEVDFVDEKGNRLIQVSYFSSLDELNKSELRSLVKGSEIVGFKDLLVSWDLEDEVGFEGKRI